MEMQHDFRLDARFDIAAQAAMDFSGIVVEGAVFIDAPPYGKVHAQRRPHRGIGESDLAADQKRALGQPRLVNPRSHVIGRVQVETRPPCCERRNVGSMVLRRLDFAGKHRSVGSGHGGS